MRRDLVPVADTVDGRALLASRTSGRSAQKIDVTSGPHKKICWEYAMASSRHLFGSLAEPGDYQGYISSGTQALKTARQREADDFPAALARTIEGEIIPRLMLAHRVAASQPVGARSAEPGRDDVSEFVDVVLNQPVEVGFAYLEAMVVRGVSAETLFLDVISPAARQLGEMWKADICDFTDVTVALSRLQQMIRHFSPMFEAEATTRSAGRQALLIPCPGEQHGLGLSMVQEFFRRAGWQVFPETPRNVEELKATIRAKSFDVIGFSLSCEKFLDDLKSAIRVARKYSKNRAVGIMVGGRIFNKHPEYVARVGADATASDGKQAMLRLPALLGVTVANR
jgi:MerR family transcriptional regulator, light-induced transcriptional regulator